MTLSTEMVAVVDPFAPLSVNAAGGTLEAFVLKDANDIINILKQLVDAPTKAIASPPPSKSPKTVPEKSLLAQFESTLADNSGIADKGAEEKVDQHSLEMMQQMSFLRCLAVQLTHLAKRNETSCAQDQAETDRLKSVILSNLPKILSIAVQDPIHAVSSIFNSGIFKGAQLDVLKNLLKEGDIAFLEKISLRLWKQNKVDVNPAMENGYGTASVDSAPLQLTAVAGEVIISETKIRALNHFPSVKLQGVGLERMTGRWFYECTLLTDGLIQVGWANAMFRCDPVNGQGVGDHTHSWAYDGLRCKKWNVSCEAYGRRWRLGDTVGALVDMDLMEIRFYLNGEDLGQAFEDFSGYDIFPALSLNVRQSVRLNFGQYKFLHPPDELDGKAFKPVLQAILEKQAVNAVLSLKNPAATSVTKEKSAPSPSMALALKAAGVEAAASGDSSDRTATEAPPTVPNSPAVLRGSLDGDATAGYTPMSPLRQALRNASATPAGAETPSTHMDTPVRLEPSSLLNPSATIALATVTEVLGGYNTPPRNVQSGDAQASASMGRSVAEGLSQEEALSNEHTAEMTEVFHY
jgi:hypothetical protein